MPQPDDDERDSPALRRRVARALGDYEDAPDLFDEALAAEDGPRLPATRQSDVDTARRHFLPSRDELNRPARYPGVGRRPHPPSPGPRGLVNPEEGEELFAPGTTAGGLDLGMRSEHPEDAEPSDADARTITARCPHCGQRTRLLPPKG